MQRTSFHDALCPIARGLDEIGEWWSLLILRDAFRGLTRFDEFQRSLGIAPNMLTRRLQRLAEAGLFVRKAYQERPVRYAYVLTEKGRALFPVIAALAAWGEEWVPRGTGFTLRSRDTGAPVRPLLTDALSGRAISPAHVELTLSAEEKAAPVSAPVHPAAAAAARAKESTHE
ncbi:helix-turn-helix domain-containing protein [Chelatococcus sp. SYSU_G07232]|uniref:Helix-turn-helix domain-containing protein n=1 Tax=Chelatococcus albus TaxID=3047466 RepID=A0ABT7AIC7_9HYPH|nr:helix-turn-helix domain-containing protein [Chelatococcus sp. SYSU_G07232]MDJ1158544.1 helix-turn-helix domain-containing protein [Chelatococcus sp. SYSU_G07232]